MLLAKHDVFKLDNQDLAEKYAGQKIKLTGTLDSNSKMIQVMTMQPVPAK